MMVVREPGVEFRSCTLNRRMFSRAMNSAILVNDLSFERRGRSCWPKQNRILP